MSYLKCVQCYLNIQYQFSFHQWIIFLISICCIAHNAHKTSLCLQFINKCSFFFFLHLFILKMPPILLDILYLQWPHFQHHMLTLSKCFPQSSKTSSSQYQNWPFWFSLSFLFSLMFNLTELGLVSDQLLRAWILVQIYHLNIWGHLAIGILYLWFDTDESILNTMWKYLLAGIYCSVKILKKRFDWHKMLIRNCLIPFLSSAS